MLGWRGKCTLLFCSSTQKWPVDDSSLIDWFQLEPLYLPYSLVVQYTCDWVPLVVLWGMAADWCLPWDVQETRPITLMINNILLEQLVALYKQNVTFCWSVHVLHPVYSLYKRVNIVFKNYQCVQSVPTVHEWSVFTSVVSVHTYMKIHITKLSFSKPKSAFLKCGSWSTSSQPNECTSRSRFE